MAQEIILRSYNPDTDKALVYNSFLNSYIRNSLKENKYPLPSMIRNIDRGLFFKYYTSELDHIFTDPNLEVKIACWSARPSEIFGYIIKQGDDLLYFYVKEKYRGRGIAKILLKSLFDSMPYCKYSTPSGLGCLRVVFGSHPVEGEH